MDRGTCSFNKSSLSMKRIKKFKDYKKRKKTVIKNIDDVPYNYNTIWRRSNPSPTFDVDIKKLNLNN